jgi:predicted nucleic acid-binding protein
VFLVDASVWVILEEPENPQYEATLAMVRDQTRLFGVLDLTLYEIANVVGVKRGDTANAQRISRLVLTLCRDRIARIDADLLDSALEVAAEHRLTAYDAAYVAAARRHGMTLVSVDIADLVSKGLAVTPDAALYP